MVIGQSTHRARSSAAPAAVLIAVAVISGPDEDQLDHQHQHQQERSGDLHIGGSGTCGRGEIRAVVGRGGRTGMPVMAGENECHPVPAGAARRDTCRAGQPRPLTSIVDAIAPGTAALRPVTYGQT